MVIGDPIRTVPPAALPLSLAELKAWCRFDLDEEDAVLAGLIRAATEEVERYTGLALITSTWRQTSSTWPTTAERWILRRRPVQTVSITHMDSSGSPVGTPIDLDPSIYRVLRLGSDTVPAEVSLAYGAVWPVAYTDPEAIAITYVAGYGDDHNAVPELIRQAIAMAAATHFAYREDVIMGSTIAELPFASQNLLRSWRPLAVA
jgi:uncharacterized phiE125 gp8 family phage protein